MEKKKEYYDVVVIGGGPAGMTAAIYCGRARLKTLLIEKSLVGGLATYTSEIENYPGFPEPIAGLELMKLFEQQTKRFGVQIKLTDVKGLRIEEDYKVVSTFRVDYYAKAVIIATGGKPRLTGAKGEENFLYDKGISFCATCDAAYYTDKKVMIIGSGDAAIEEGIFLTKFAREVHVSVIHDEGIMDANKVAQEKALKNEKMIFHWNTMVEAFEGNERLERVVLKNLKTGELIPVDVDGCFLFIGYVPNTEIFKGLINMTPKGYIITNENMETNIDGVYAVGDVRDKFLRQVATAVGDGAIAGVMAEKYIEETDYFTNEILKAKETVLAYVYNAVEAKDREYLLKVEEFHKKYADKLKMCRIDIYKSDRLAKRLYCEKVPCIAVVKEGKVAKHIYDLEDFEKELLSCI
ncbi:FAD-dependent oxidoreductase [Thermoanaerobacter sp. CM-CNRG TB177]|jgi:thioredoxin reductase (NADPH)|uniref:NAD(P)/FAD-dependent oxidoreductase n=1 Tax=Thermoanaerobacter TaxID=1754 RepID=UPI00048BE11E|nr:MULTISPECIES: FAD-dependent oxidoreductase [Thermoanaerobacter]MBT1279060.1 FAD-dependent oxidoreductase [Thermoanaerobacter sp. CM-CNRG TB177]MDI3529565.1 thioredoxin reductase [Thermoanaerobacter sp.]